MPFSNADRRSSWGDDVLGGLSPEQEMLREMVASFADREVEPLAREIDRDERFPTESWKRSAELGLLGIAVPEEYGGAGCGLIEMCLVGEELSRVCVSTSATVLHQADLVANRFVRHGDEEQKRRYLPAICDGSSIGCLAMTEPGAGSDVLSMSTSARPVDGGWLLNGTKTFITSAPVADFALVYARTGSREDRSLGLFVVPADIPGYVRGKKFEKLGWRGSPTGELSFDDCFVPAENLIGGADEGRSIMFAGLTSERVVMAAEAVGIAQGALAVAVAYAREREQFGKPIGEFQMIQAKLADIFAETEACRALTYQAAALLDSGRESEVTLPASAAKMLSADVAMRASTEAVQILGGYGYIKEFPVERYMRDAKLMQIGGGTGEIQRRIIGRSLVRHGLRTPSRETAE
jgi:isovaleryl-CoA dehydrogenase